jgi:hypothetical protein
VYYLQGGDESLRPINIKTFLVLFVILWTTNTIILTGDFSSIVLRDSRWSSLQGEIILEKFAKQIRVYDMGQYCLASIRGPSDPFRGFHVERQGEQCMTSYNGTNVIPHIERDEGTDTRVFGPKSNSRITSLRLYSGTRNKTRSHFANGSIPRDLSPMWEKVGNCG